MFAVPCAKLKFVGLLEVQGGVPMEKVIHLEAANVVSMVKSVIQSAITAINLIYVCLDFEKSKAIYQSLKF
jgi:hypothetical protein